MGIGLKVILNIVCNKLLIHYISRGIRVERKKKVERIYKSITCTVILKRAKSHKLITELLEEENIKQHFEIKNLWIVKFAIFLYGE